MTGERGAEASDVGISAPRTPLPSLSGGQRISAPRAPLPTRDACLRGLAKVLVAAAIRIETERLEAEAVREALGGDCR